MESLKDHDQVQNVSMSLSHGAAMDCVLRGWQEALGASMVETPMKFVNGINREVESIGKVVIVELK